MTYELNNNSIVISLEEYNELQKIKKSEGYYKKKYNEEIDKYRSGEFSSETIDSILKEDGVAFFSIYDKDKSIMYTAVGKKEITDIIEKTSKELNHIPKCIRNIFNK
jgi:hypothetical protein